MEKGLWYKEALNGKYQAVESNFAPYLLVSRINRKKRLATCWWLDGHFKEPYEMSMALGARP